MPSPKPLTPEMVRILRAARDGRLVRDATKWRILKEQAPLARERKRCFSRRLITNPLSGLAELTRHGDEALDAYELNHPRGADEEKS